MAVIAIQTSQWTAPSQVAATPVGEYLVRRQALISEDRAQRPDAHTRPLSKDEAEADKLVRVVRAKEAVDVWGPDSNSDFDDGTHLFPGMAFLTGEHDFQRGSPLVPC